MIAYTEYARDARIRREAETLAAHGFDVTCLALETRTEPQSAEYMLDGVRVQELPIAKYRGKRTVAYVASYLRFLAAASSVCIRLLARGRLDVVHVHNIPDFLVLAGLVPRLAGRKVILDIHDSVPETFSTKFSAGRVLRKTLCIEEWLSALVAHRLICVNHQQRETLVARGIPRSKTFVSMNVPDPRIFNDRGSQAHPAASNGELNLVYHGTMAMRLGVDLLIHAVGNLSDRIPGVRLHLWGHGDDLADFQRLARDLHVDDKVLFRPTGYPLHELPTHLSSMHVGAIGNRRSDAGDLMLPVKLLEYVALRIPVVAPRLKTIEHYFADDMVAYYDAGDVESLSDAILRLYADPVRRLSQAERARTFLARYGWEQQGPELVRMYRSVVENRIA